MYSWYLPCVYYQCAESLLQNLRIAVRQVDLPSLLVQFCRETTASAVVIHSCSVLGSTRPVSATDDLANCAMADRLSPIVACRESSGRCCHGHVSCAWRRLAKYYKGARWRCDLRHRLIRAALA